MARLAVVIAASLLVPAGLPLVAHAGPDGAHKQDPPSDPPNDPPPDAKVSEPTPAPTPTPTPPPTPKAPDAKPSQRDIEIARRYYIEAKAAHERGDYTMAASSYLNAYKLYPKPAFLYNAAQVFRLSGDKTKALENYKRYLALEPDGSGSAFSKEFIPQLEAEIEADRKAEAERPPDIKAPPKPPPKPNTEKDKLIVIDDSSKAGAGKRYVGIGVMVAGVAAIAVGTGFAIHARNLSNEASEFQGAFGPELQSLYDRGESAERNAIIAGAAGGLALVVGGLVYYLGARDQRRAERNQDWFAVPSVGPNGGSLVLGARF